jgi:hypothetical protein
MTKPDDEQYDKETAERVAAARRVGEIYRVVQPLVAGSSRMRLRWRGLRCDDCGARAIGGIAWDRAQLANWILDHRCTTGDR